MKVWIPRQTQPDETRAAMVPAVLKKLAKLGVQVQVEHDLGQAAGYSNSDYADAGAQVIAAAQSASAWADADVVLTIHPPEIEQAASLKAGAIVLGMLAPLKNTSLVRELATRNVTAFSAEFIPRISRAQPMDVLSSQANIGGYKAALLAADECPKIFPMMMTAAGTISPARVFVLGAGVAGLQAIATARRLGAVVQAYDVRATVKEQIQSLGARFVELTTAKQEDKSTGGYARELTAEERAQQVETMAKHLIESDAVIATAALFGKAPPLLIPRGVVERMSPGSVIVDLAADPEAGRGNCECTVPSQVITTANGVRIVGLVNLPALVPVHSSLVYANNMLAFLREIIDKGELKLNLDDEILKGAAITHGGQIVNTMVAQAIDNASAQKS